ncbi:MAG: ribosome rescue protein RqcH [Candidatus Korarchaeum sp.]
MPSPEGRIRGMTGLDLLHMTRELRLIEGSFVKKFYSIDENTLSLVFHPEREGRRELIIDTRGAVFLTKLKWSKPQTPSPFAMILRKRLENSRIEKVYQMGLERILVLEFSRDDLKLIIELFGAGNAILLSDNEISAALRKAEYRDREIRVGVPYKPPPGGVHLDDLSKDSLSKAIRGLPADERVSRVMVSFGLGPPYLDEALLMVGVRADSKLSDVDVDALIHSISEFLNRKAEPTVYMEGEDVVEYSAFPLTHLTFERRYAETFSDAVEVYYTSKRSFAEDRRVLSLEKEIERQLSLRREYEESYERFKRLGDLLISNLHEVDEVLRIARLGGSSELIRSLDRRSGRVVALIDGEVIELDLRRSASENAAEYYSKAKKMREKAARVNQAISQLEEKLRSIRSSVEREISELKPRPRRRMRWYERFRWFYTSSKLLVLCGRDAQTNSEIVDRYMERDDLFFHVDMPGGAVVILKTGGVEPDQESIEQAAVAAASFSRAWREGFSYADVYYVRGDQVSKHAPSGMYLPKGSFYITGKRNYLRVKLELAIGFQETIDGLKLTAAPPNSPFICSARIRPGSMRKEEAAIRIKNKLAECLERNVKIIGFPESSVDELTVDGIVRLMPPGRVELEE